MTRGRAVARLATVEPADVLAGRLAVLAHGDGSPAVRAQALALLAEHDPDHAKRLLHRGLFDPSAAVRGLARFLASKLDPAIDSERSMPATSVSRSATLVTAVAGLGDVGTRADADRLASFLTADAPRLRRAALLSTAKLDPDRGLPLATAASLKDSAGSVRSTARRISCRNAPGLDFQALAHRLPAVADARARLGMLRLLAEASKWDAAVYLLEALTIAIAPSGISRRNCSRPGSRSTTAGTRRRHRNTWSRFACCTTGTPRRYARKRRNSSRSIIS